MRGFSAVFSLLVMLGLSASVNAQSPLQVYTLSYPPFMYEENGVIKGVQVDIVKEAFKRLNQPIEMHLVHLLRGLKMVELGEADVFFSPFKTEERAKVMHYGETPLYIEDIVLVARKDSKRKFVGTLENLIGSTIAMKDGFFMGDQLDQSFKNKTITRHDVRDLDQMVKMVASGRADFFGHERFNAALALAKFDTEHELEIQMPPVESAAAYVVFSKQYGKTSLVEDFDRMLEAIYREGFVEQLEQQYLKDASLPN